MVGRYLAALGILVAAAVASAEIAPHPQHVAIARQQLAQVPVPKADRDPEAAKLRAEQLDEFAIEIARASADRPNPRQHMALLTVIGQHETHFETRLVLGLCRKWECDRGRARGAFQNHSVSFTAELWKVADGNIRAQVEMADRVLRRSMTRCAPFAPFPAHVFRAYRGGGAASCSFALRDEQRRVAAFNRLMGVKTGGAS